MRTKFSLLFIAAIHLWAGTAHADAGDLEVRAQAMVERAHNARVGAGVDFGVNNWLSTRVASDFRFVGGNRVAVNTGIGPSFRFDVLTWVPMITPMLIVRNEPSHVAYLGTAVMVEIARYVSMHQRIGLQTSMEWTPGYKAQPWLVSVGMSWSMTIIP